MTIVSFFLLLLLFVAVEREREKRVETGYCRILSDFRALINDSTATTAQWNFIKNI
jgi:hypothetical protein